jgi:integrase
MVSNNNDEIMMPGRINKNRKPHVVPLVGPLSEISVMLKQLRKKFPQPTDHVCDFGNFRNIWNETCGGLGLGKYDRKTRKYEGLMFRRSAARNLTKAGVTKTVAKKITGHRTDHIFDRYAIQTDDDVKDALIKVGRYKKPAQVAEMAPSR